MSPVPILLLYVHQKMCVSLYPPGPSILADRQQRMALLLRRHFTWPLRPVLGKNQTIHNWATLLGDNPPCVISP